MSRSFLALVRILGDPIKPDLFSKSRFTKHCKWAHDDSVETQFLLFCRPSCGIIRRTYARDYYDGLNDLSLKKTVLVLHRKKALCCSCFLKISYPN